MTISPTLAAQYRDRKAADLRRLDELIQALQHGDASALEGIRQLAHGLSGVCGAFGEPGLGDLARAAEEACAAGPQADAAAAAVALQTALAEGADARKR
jgi:HPt (histidine-containing phosphotransfer) domain-containing protein